ncbi:MAG: hypothetical protein OEU97_03715 [Dehalococcoidia bacterium]|nr:hypothetical protein [Dehalococcoidia bacterium]
MLEKLNHHLKRFGILLITAALIAGMAACDGGPPCPCTTSPPSQNLEIRTWYDLNATRDNLAGNHTLMSDLDSNTPGYTELASPIANQGKGWQPIGTFIPMCSCASFTGTLDGQGYEIRDLYINRPDEYLVGLFGCVYEQGGVIENVGVTNFTVIGKSTVGGLVGRNMGTVSSSYAIGNVNADVSVGGLVGYNQGPVSNCYATGNVVAGGVVGNVSAVIGGFGVGGLIGLSEGGPVDNCYFAGNVTSYLSCADKWNFLAGVGGLVGVNYDTVSNSHSNANVTGKYGVGGLVGRNLYGTISNSYFTGSVTGSADVGGLMGSNMGDGSLSNSFYNYDEALINGESINTMGALFDKDFEEWLANGKFLDVNERLSQENGYYVVNNVTDFKELMAFGQNATLKFRLKNDLDLATESNFYIPYLAGEFDGNGHKISNLSLNSDLVSLLGLFGYLAPGGKVTQVGVENVNVTGYSSVGGLVGGTRHGTVSDCYSTGNVAGNSCVGGLAGDSGFGIVSDSYSTATVTGYSVVGGLIGGNSGTVTGGTVSNSCSHGDVTGSAAVGGLVGVNQGTVSNSYSTGTVIGDEGVGGLAGVNSGLGTVNNSFWDIQSSGQSASDGGTGKNTTEMQDIVTFSDAGWNITAVALNETNPAYIWNIVSNVTYPFLTWQP